MRLVFYGSYTSTQMLSEFWPRSSLGLAFAVIQMTKPTGTTSILGWNTDTQNQLVHMTNRPCQYQLPRMLQS
jgi:hypothetical protein